jgi:hypothetical protein
VKINTAAVAVEDRTCKKMVNVYKYGPKEYQDNPPPVFFKEKKTDRKGQQKMYPIMQEESKHLQNLGEAIPDRPGQRYLH